MKAGPDRETATLIITTQVCIFHDMKQVDREALTRRVAAALRRSRIVALLGPRQCGKSSLARSAFADSCTQFVW
jgi:predicted AAA+ superfamily ATPase